MEYLFPLRTLYRLSLGCQSPAGLGVPDVPGGLLVSVDLGVGGGEGWPAFVENHDPVALLDLGAEALEAVCSVVPVAAVGVLFLDAGVPEGVESLNPAIA